jgi:hypothetical protein
MTSTQMPDVQKMRINGVILSIPQSSDDSEYCTRPI